MTTKKTFEERKREEFEKKLKHVFTHCEECNQAEDKKDALSFLTSALAEQKEVLRKEVEKMRRGACCDCAPEEGHKCYHAGREDVIYDLLKILE